MTLSNLDTQLSKPERNAGGAWSALCFALSDQQLATGFAVMIAGYAQRCSMSIYHFKIIASLAWFSSSIHLATLGMLREYFADHRSVRNWRVAGMIVHFVMLVYAQIIPRSEQDISLPLQCIMRPPFFQGDALDLLEALTIMAFLGTMYTRRIMRLFAEDPDWSISGWMLQKPMKLRNRFINGGDHGHQDHSKQQCLRLTILREGSSSE